MILHKLWRFFFQIWTKCSQYIVYFLFIPELIQCIHNYWNTDRHLISYTSSTIFKVIRWQCTQSTHINDCFRIVCFIRKIILKQSDSSSYQLKIINYLIIASDRKLHYITIRTFIITITRIEIARSVKLYIT